MSVQITSVGASQTEEILGIAESLAAAQGGLGRIQPTDSDRDITVETGYIIQQTVTQLRRQAGENVVGYKIGLTSPASQELFSASQPIAGSLWERSVFEETDRISLAGMHAPLVEVEVAFIMRTALEGPGITAREALAATETISLALEIVDSRWSGDQPGLGQIVADNANAAAIVMGPRISNTDLDVSTIQVNVQIEQQTLSGKATNVMGNPLHAVSWLVDQLSTQNKRIEAGQTILSGTMTVPTPVHPGDRIRVDIRGLATMAVTIADS